MYDLGSFFVLCVIHLHSNISIFAESLQKTFSFMGFYLSIFGLHSWVNEVLIRKLFPIPLSSRVPPLFFLAQLHHFRFYTVVFDPFGVDIWCRGIDVDLISFFCRWMSSFPCPISITLSLSFSVYFWHFCQITDGCS